MMEGHKYLTAHFSDKEKRIVESYWVDDKAKVKKGQQKPIRLSYINVCLLYTSPSPRDRG